MPIRRVAAQVVPFLFLLLSPALYAQTRFSSVFPQFATGGGWSSDIFIDNQGGLTGVVDVSFFDDTGAALQVDSTLGVGSVFSFSLAPGNTKPVRVVSTGALRTGYVVISFPSGSSVRASEIFRYQQGGAVVSALGVAQQFPFETSFSFPVEVDLAKRINTAVALANVSFETTGNTAQSCVVSLVQSDGTLYGSTAVFLAAGAHVASYLDQLFPGLDNFVGTVSVSGVHAFGMTALRQDEAVFSTVSVDAGPIVAPFLLTQSSISESEPNSTTAQAQSIGAPVVIAGNISFAGDVDYFRITGKKGDIVTAVAVTDPTVSGLDSLVGILNSDTSVLVLNDDNGLFFQSDSFTQAVLPADGTYYVAVTDSQSRGGANGTYRLHVQVKTPPSASPGAAPSVAEGAATPRAAVGGALWTTGRRKNGARGRSSPRADTRRSIVE